MKTVPISAIRSDHLEAAKGFLEIPEKEKPLSTWNFYETIAELWENTPVEELPPIIIRPTPAPFRVIGPAHIEVKHPVLFPQVKKILLWEYFVTLDLADAHRVPVVVGTMEMAPVPYGAPPPSGTQNSAEVDKMLAVLKEATNAYYNMPTTTAPQKIKKGGVTSSPAYIPPVGEWGAFTYAYDNPFAPGVGVVPSNMPTKKQIVKSKTMKLSQHSPDPPELIGWADEEEDF